MLNIVNDRLFEIMEGMESKAVLFKKNRCSQIQSDASTTEQERDSSVEDSRRVHFQKRKKLKVNNAKRRQDYEVQVYGDKGEDFPPLKGFVDKRPRNSGHGDKRINQTGIEDDESEVNEENQSEDKLGGKRDNGRRINKDDKDRWVKPKVRRIPRSSVINLKRSSEKVSYADMLRKARENISLAEMGIEKTRIRYATTGNVLIEVYGENNNLKADKLAKKLNR